MHVDTSFALLEPIEVIVKIFIFYLKKTKLHRDELLIQETSQYTDTAVFQVTGHYR